MSRRTFAAVEPLESRRLWSALSVVQLTHVPAEVATPGPADATSFGGDLYYTAAADTGGPALLWRTDGTAAGTSTVATAGGPALSGVTGVAAGPGAVYAVAGDAVFATDGTAPLAAVATLPVADAVLIGATADAVFAVGAASSDVYAARADGTVTTVAHLSTPLQVTDAGQVVAPDAVAVGDALYYSAGGQLVRTDGTMAGTAVLGSFAAGGSPINLTDLTAVGPRVYGVDGVDHLLYATDGTVAGTAALSVAGANGPLVASGERLFFTVGGRQDSRTFAYDLASVDAAGTATLSSLQVYGFAEGGAFDYTLASLGGGRVAVIGEGAPAEVNGTGPVGLYASDGTDAGTTELVPTGLYSFAGGGLVSAGDGTVFADALTAAPDADGNLVPGDSYRTDGTAAGTAVVATGLPAGAARSAGGTLFSLTSDVVLNNGTLAAKGQLYALSETPTPSPAPVPAAVSVSVVRSTVPTAAVAGARFGGAVRLALADATAAAAGGPTAVRLYATSGSDRMLLGQASRRLAVGRSTATTVAVRRASLPAGTYAVVAEVTTPAGTVDRTVGTLDVAAVTLTAAVAGAGPSAVVVTITNVGTVVGTGRLSVALGLSADGGATVAVPLKATTVGGRVRPGRPVAVRVRYRIPAAAVAGTYRLVATVIGTAVDTTAVGPEAVVGGD